VAPTPAPTPAPTALEDQGGSRGGGSAVVVGGAVGGVVALVAAAALCYRRGQRARIQMPVNELNVPESRAPADGWGSAGDGNLMGSSGSGGPSLQNSLQTGDAAVPEITWEALMDATAHMAPSNLIGEGGYGKVYKGTLPFLGDEGVAAGGRAVAVKFLEGDSMQGLREFQREVHLMSRARHENLLPLLGYCAAGGHPPALVYRLMEQGSLHHVLMAERRPLDLATRVFIAREMARGLDFLHREMRPPVLHRDFKPENVLLGDPFGGVGGAYGSLPWVVVGDFGMSRILQHGDGLHTLAGPAPGVPVPAAMHATTRVVGTFGYIDPGYAETGRVTEGSDVYSFGVVLLVLMARRPPYDAAQAEADRRLVPLARELLGGSEQAREGPGGAAWVYKRLLDEEMGAGGEDGPRGEHVQEMLEIAVACSAASTPRPAMSYVVDQLTQLLLRITSAQVRECVVCLSEPRARVLEPCDHFVTCQQCTDDLLARSGERLCPMCRVPVTGNRERTMADVDTWVGGARKEGGGSGPVRPFM